MATCIATGFFCWKFSREKDTDGMFKDDLNLYKLAQMALPERVPEFVDPIFLLGEEATRREEIKTGMLILGIGVACSMEAPRDRMKLFSAAKELKLIKDMLFEKLEF